MTEDSLAHVSRRNFITGVVAVGEPASSAYLFRSTTVPLQDYEKILTALMRGAELLRG